MLDSSFSIHYLGLSDYVSTWQAMRSFTDTRSEATPDQLWLVEHHSVYTLGLHGSLSDFTSEPSFPVVHSDRGGQTTWHGPGQLVAYLLVDLRRRHLGVRTLVTVLEQSVIQFLKQYGMIAETRRDAPGVYVKGKKIAFVGLRIRRGSSYHGISLNVSPDLSPFSMIHPCGHVGLAVTSLAEHRIDARPCDVAAPLALSIIEHLSASR